MYRGFCDIWKFLVSTSIKILREVLIPSRTSFVYDYQQAFTCLKLAIETLEKCEKSVQS